MIPKSNRYKVMFIPNKLMFKLITGECLIKNIPEFTKLCEVQPNFERRGWDIIIEHPSFPEIYDLAVEPERILIEIEETGKRNGRKLYFD